MSDKSNKPVPAAADKRSKTLSFGNGGSEAELIQELCITASQAGKALANRLTTERFLPRANEDYACVQVRPFPQEQAWAKT